MEPTFKMCQGNVVTISDTLTSDCTPIDLTGATVVFLFQYPGGNASKPATIVTPTAGQVSYTFASADTTAAAGDYSGQWQVTDASGNVRNIPTRPFTFVVEPGLPITAPSQYTTLSEFFPDIRAITGDFKKRVYQDGDIQSAMRAVIRLGKVKDERRFVPAQNQRCIANPSDGSNEEWPPGQILPPTRWTLTPDLRGIAPAILPTDIQAYSLLVYHTAHMLVQPNIEAYKYRTRALSESFGARTDFLFNLENALFDLENGQGVWHDIMALKNWLFAINGIWVWNFMQAERNVELSYH